MATSETAEEVLSAYGARLLIPANPTFDFEADPDGQPEYVNPVTAANYQIVYANALIELTDTIVKRKRRLRAVRKERREAARAVESFESRMLRQFPPRKQTDVKTLKVQQAYLEAKAEEAGQSETYATLRARLNTLEDEHDDLTEGIGGARDYLDAIKAASEGSKTFLAFYKAERAVIERAG